MSYELRLGDLAAIPIAHAGKGMTARVLVTFDEGRTFYATTRAVFFEDEDEIVLEVDKSNEVGPHVLPEDQQPPEDGN